MENTIPLPLDESNTSLANNQKLIDLIQAGENPICVEGLTGASKALFLVELWKSVRRSIIVLAADQNTGEALLGDLRYFVKRNKLKTIPKLFPSWELLPYEQLSPLAEITGERLAILDSLMNDECGIVIVPVESAMQYLMPRSVLKNLTYTVRVGEKMDREILEECLIDNGFERSHMVEERGQFSSRGDILDLFLASHENPIRLEFFGDEIESIRYFDINSQVSIENIDEAQILPVKEFCLTKDQLAQGVVNIKKFADEQCISTAKADELIEKLECLKSFGGMELYASFFHHEKECIFDYLPDDALIISDENELIESKSEDVHESITEEYYLSLDREELAPLPEEIYLNSEKFIQRMHSKNFISMDALKLTNSESINSVQYNIKPSLVTSGKFDMFIDKARQWQKEGFTVTVVAPTKGHVRRVNELLLDKEITLSVENGIISSGFLRFDPKEVYVGEHELFGRTHKRRQRKRSRSNAFQRGFKDLKIDDLLVHVDYGIGQYMGTRELTTGVGGGEFMEILYADDEKLYIPMDGLACIQKYLSSGDTKPLLNKMGGVGWKRQKLKIKKSIQEMAGELLKVHASRKVAQGHGFSSHPVMVQEFADSFEFVETDDQLKAIDDVIRDMENDKPMDRLVCGDVGYGKTEVAMRAAFKATMDNKQVAVLAPTTILAQQHLNSFRERFSAYPVNIDMVSRFRTAKEQKETLARLNAGQVDIIIGTHRLLSNDVKFLDLGLIIVDEEQRFGVKHKEKFKKFRAEVDIITLTATPIPRTLHFALMGVRDLSIIESPPSDRLSIKTYVRKFDERIIHDAISRELDRGGQVFFVHNKVKNIHSVAGMIQKVVGNAKIGVAHGQMPEKKLEEVMKSFIGNEINVLVCTSIVESGLDIPSANTIIIHRADQFGLAQLYQLRGRVGRYKHQAYAYLLIPGAKAISSDARKRLAAIEEMSDLGAGFQLAARDMEIRGTGNMLGKQQSGHISMVGFDLYCQMVEESMKEIKGENIQAKIEPQIDLQIKGSIPKDYIADLNQRLDFYRRLQLLSELHEFESIEKELVDRYGPLPSNVVKLIAVLEIKLLCQKLHISKVMIVDNEILCSIESTTCISRENFTKIMDGGIRLLSEYRMAIRVVNENWKEDVKEFKEYLLRLLDLSDG
ncbi:MAG: transcription-repair coupling factor [Nitrospinales bacterium]